MKQDSENNSNSLISRFNKLITKNSLKHNLFHDSGDFLKLSFNNEKNRIKI